MLVLHNALLLPTPLYFTLNDFLTCFIRFGLREPPVNWLWREGFFWHNKIFTAFRLLLAIRLTFLGSTFHRFCREVWFAFTGRH